MIFCGDTVCPSCGGYLKYYDTVKRKVLYGNRVSKTVYIRRMRCIKCGYLHRELPESAIPHKQYASYIILGFNNGILNSDILEYENYPSDQIIRKWKREIYKYYYENIKNGG